MGNACRTVFLIYFQLVARKGGKETRLHQFGIVSTIHFPPENIGSPPALCMLDLAVIGI
jgi:hypothetical protein